MVYDVKIESNETKLAIKCVNKSVGAYTKHNQCLINTNDFASVVHNTLSNFNELTTAAHGMSVKWFTHWVDSHTEMNWTFTTTYKSYSIYDVCVMHGTGGCNTFFLPQYLCCDTQKRLVCRRNGICSLSS